MATIAIARAYQQSFDARPHTTLAITGGLFNALGDFVAQVYQNTIGLKPRERPRTYDIARTLRFFCFGFAMSPLLGRWNQFLEHTFPLRSNGPASKVSWVALGKRVACDQIVLAPFGLALFLGTMGIMEGRNRRQIQQKYSDIYVPALLTNWKVWPAAQLINFRYMPLPYRIPFQSTCGVFWTLYLSMLNSREDAKQDREAAMHRILG
ncbi:hypothetical protein PC9H_003895 [Pleurotus ostreatus]|uniref:Uncharacterized protein n=1 Tax=Pleurotus ostreatus TaxID=5322 RepID=A0A8H7DYF0_PLEOS|nr:uncharacterized protein PC9H_003895 [Pleurotus ostreatus]KAF7437061.1 hypothetical protein PC9H_003895 [Pleurotus ostreatus]KAJ8702906.1 hypothetical protein PTI98_001579 [Pleurotus ostreatus]